MSGQRVLIASPLGHIVQPALAEQFGDGIAVAVGPAETLAAVAGRVRFDVVITDLLWNSAEHEYSFDGFDVMDLLRRHDRTAPVIVATQGHGLEADHLDEVAAHPEVVGVVHKANGLPAVLAAIDIAASGQRLRLRAYPAPIRSDDASIHTYFGRGRRGATAARLAGAIASGRASDNRSLQAATHIPLNTANKVGSYLGPLMLARKEHSIDLPMTSQAVYRWCGEHARYILSWCRRNGHADIAMRAG
ncbi:MAG: response regulator [Jatrophihabitantaceae bacterium]